MFWKRKEKVAESTRLLLNIPVSEIISIERNRGNTEITIKSNFPGPNSMIYYISSKQHEELIRQAFLQLGGPIVV